MGQRAASFWPQKPQLFVGSIHCGTWFCGFSEEWGMTERSGRDPGAGIRSARTGLDPERGGEVGARRR